MIDMTVDIQDNPNCQVPSYLISILFHTNGCASTFERLTTQFSKG